ncbi:MAG: hypothetical protein ACI4VL_03140 [Bacilli bacterium]
MILVILVVAIIYLNNLKQKEIDDLNVMLQDIEEKEELVASYNEELPKIKDLKQKIMGQEYKIEEFSKQIQDVTNLLMENRNKLDELQNY